MYLRLFQTFEYTYTSFSYIIFCNLHIYDEVTCIDEELLQKLFCYKELWQEFFTKIVTKLLQKYPNMKYQLDHFVASFEVTKENRSLCSWI